MTLHDTCSQLHALSVGGYINGEKFTADRFHNWAKALFRGNSDRLVFEIALPDGRWYGTITRLPNGEFGWYIPETREQEKRILALIA